MFSVSTLTMLLAGIWYNSDDLAMAVGVRSMLSDWNRPKSPRDRSKWVSVASEMSYKPREMEHEAKNSQHKSRSSREISFHYFLCFFVLNLLPTRKFVSRDFPSRSIHKFRWRFYVFSRLNFCILRRANRNFLLKRSSCPRFRRHGRFNCNPNCLFLCMNINI